MPLKEYRQHIDLERAFYDKLANYKELHDPSITVDGILKLCETIEPSEFLGTGGMYFELFILRFGMEKHRKTILSLLTTEDGKMQTEDQEAMYKEYALRFWFETISKLAMVKRKCNTQLFLFTLAMDYRGLSRMGIQYLAFCGVATHPRTFDRKRNVDISTYENVIKLLLTTGSAVIGWDNFCHSFWSPKIDVGREYITMNTNCTVGALSVTEHPIDNRFIYDSEGKIIPSVPESKFTLAKYVEQVISELKDALCDIKDVTGDLYTYWPMARVVRDVVQRVPAQLDHPLPTDDNKDHSRGLKHFIPWFVSADNPSSNQGTANTFTRIIRDCKENLKKSYIYLRIDGDPYMKVLRVIFFMVLFISRHNWTRTRFSITVDFWFVQSLNSSTCSNMEWSLFGNSVPFSEGLLRLSCIYSFRLVRCNLNLF